MSVPLGLTTVGWGLAGCGWVTRDHMAPALAASGFARAVALYDPDPAALGRVAALLPGARGYDDLGAFLAADGLQAVYVATPNDVHAQVAVAAATARKAVLVEKPLAADVVGAEAIVVACEAAGVIAGTAFDQRWHPAHAKMSDLVDAGRLGTVSAVRITYGCWLPADWSPDGGAHDNWRVVPARAGGGALLDLAPHGIDLVGSILGDDPVALRVLTSSTVHGYAVDDAAVLAGRTRKGVLVSQHVSYATPDTLPRRRLEVVGTLGQLTAVDTLGQTAGGRLTFTDAADGSTDDVPFDTQTSPFAVQLDRFSRAVTGAGPWGYHLLRDLRLHRLLLDAAAAEGQP